MNEANLNITTENKFFLHDEIAEPWSRNDTQCCCPPLCSDPIIPGFEYPTNRFLANKGTLTNTSGGNQWMRFDTLEDGEGIATLEYPRPYGSYRTYCTVELILDNTDSGAGIIFSYTDNDNFYYVMFDLAKRVMTSDIKWRHEFRTRVIQRSAGVDTVLQENTIRYLLCPEYIGLIGIPVRLGLLTDNTLNDRLSLKFRDAAPDYYPGPVGFPYQTWVDNYYRTLNYPPLDTASTEDFGTNVSIGKIVTGVGHNVETAYSTLTKLPTVVDRPGPWGNEEGTKCPHYGMYHDLSKQNFLPEYWVVKVTTVIGYSTYINHYRVASGAVYTNPSGTTLHPGVYYRETDSNLPGSSTYYNVGTGFGVKPWKDAAFVLSVIMNNNFSGYFGHTTYYDEIDFWQYDEYNPLVPDDLTMVGYVTDVRMWPVTEHPTGSNATY